MVAHCDEDGDDNSLSLFLSLSLSLSRCLSVSLSLYLYMCLSLFLPHQSSGTNSILLVVWLVRGLELTNCACAYPRVYMYVYMYTQDEFQKLIADDELHSRMTLAI